MRGWEERGRRDRKDMDEVNVLAEMQLLLLHLPSLRPPILNLDKTLHTTYNHCLQVLPHEHGIELLDSGEQGL